MISRASFILKYPKLNPENFFPAPFSDTELLEKFLPSKLWRLNNLYTIIDKDGRQVIFCMNDAQHTVYSQSLQHPRLIILKSRQQGISTFWLISFLDDCLFNSNLSAGLMANGVTEAATLLHRVKLAWSNFPLSLKTYFELSQTKDNASEIGFSNGSSLFIRTSFRSATLQRLHISEMGKIANHNPARAEETKTGTLQAIKSGNTVIIESTAEGKNMFSDDWDQAVMHQGGFAGKDFKPVFLSWLGDPDCVSPREETQSEKVHEYFSGLESVLDIAITAEQRNFWLMQQRELGDKVYQEYPATAEEAFTTSRDGTFYASLFLANITLKGRLVDNLWDKNLPVTAVFDLGMNDTFVITFWQDWQGSVRLIDEYRNSGEGLAHYVGVMDKKPYTIDLVVLPHDVKVRELSTGQSRLHRLRKLGLTRTRVLPKIAVSDGIEATRRMMENLWVDKKCTYCVDCFNNYSKDWDSHTQTWKDKPLHNEYSHGADCIRYKAVSLLGTKKPRKKRGPQGFDV